MIFAITAFASSVPAASIARKIGCNTQTDRRADHWHQVIRYLSVGRRRCRRTPRKLKKKGRKRTTSSFVFLEALHCRQEMLLPIVRRDSQPLGATPTIVEPGQKDPYGSSSTFTTSAGHVPKASDCSRLFPRVDSRSANTATAGKRLAPPAHHVGNFTFCLLLSEA